MGNSIDPSGTLLMTRSHTRNDVLTTGRSFWGTRNELVKVNFLRVNSPDAHALERRACLDFMPSHRY